MTGIGSFIIIMTNRAVNYLKFDEKVQRKKLFLYMTDVYFDEI